MTRASWTLTLFSLATTAPRGSEVRMKTQVETDHRPERSANTNLDLTKLDDIVLFISHETRTVR